MFAIGKKRECRRVRGKLSEYIDDRLGCEERDWMESHLGVCDACSKELETLRMTVHLLNQVQIVPVPRSFAIREAETGEEKVPEPRRWDGMRPVPVYAVASVYSARARIMDPQRMRWLRPATAFVTAALVLLLMLDFLQVVPHGGWLEGNGVIYESPPQSMLAPSPGMEDWGAKLGENGSVPATPVPAPSVIREAESDDVTSEWLTSAVGEDVHLADETKGGWP
ncbi:MAG: zf-HC2 domain-containing protein, partial [Dehalococcoidia bacterium]